MIGLKAIEFCIPGKSYLVEELAEIQALEGFAREAFDLLELKKVTIADDYDNRTLAFEASQQAIKAANLGPQDIDMIIYIQSRTPDYLMSSEATRLQEDLGATNAYSFAITDLGCANISNALLMAKNYLLADPRINHILISTGSKPYGQGRYRDGVTIIGDAGLGVIVSRTDSNQIIDGKLMTDGQFWDLYKLDYKNYLAKDYKESCTRPKDKFKLSLLSRNNFEKLNEEICQENQISKIDAYIMQNLSISAFDFNEDAFNVKLAQSSYYNMREYGHLGGMDILLNYKRSILTGEIKKDDIVLIMNNSPMACWSSMLIKV